MRYQGRVVYGVFPRATAISCGSLTWAFRSVFLLGQIRGELMRASRILASRPDRAIVALSQLCEERKDEEAEVPEVFDKICAAGGEST